VAMDAKTGAVLGDPDRRYQEGLQRTVAPLVVKNKVILGVAGASMASGDSSTLRCRYGQASLEVLDGRGAGRSGGSSWAAIPGKRGGGSILGYGTYDPESNLTYLGTGNPGRTGTAICVQGTTYIRPRWSRRCRYGEVKVALSEYAARCSDWDSISEPIPIDSVINGRSEAIVQANRKRLFLCAGSRDG